MVEVHGKAEQSGGRAAARALLALLALLAGALAARLFLRDEDPSRTAAADPRSALELRDPAPASAVSAAGERAATAELNAPFEVHEIGVAPGVRLPGDGRLEGRVLDRATGAPVPGARVDLCTVTPAASEWLRSMLSMARGAGGMEQSALPVAVTTSGADGRFAFAGVRRGRYFLDARGDFHVPDQIVLVRVARSGDGGPVDFFVRAGGRVVGRVLRADGGPAAGATVVVQPGAGHWLAAFRAGDLRQLETRADSGGKFAVAGVAPGAGYQASAVAPGLVLTHARVPDVRAGEDAEVEIRARAGATVAGRVLSSGGDPEEAPVPLAGAELAVLPRGLRDMAFADHVMVHCLARTDAEGRYAIAGAPPGEVELVVRADGHVGGTSPPIELAEGGSAVVPDVVLRRGPLARGRVVDGASNPLPGVHVRWFTGEANRPLSFDVSLAPLMHQYVGDYRYPETDAEGRFAAGPFPGEPPHRIYFAKAGYTYTRLDFDPRTGDGELLVTLARGGAVEGVVRDALTREPVTSFRITGSDLVDQRFDAPSSWNPFSGGVLVEDPAGRFRLDGVLPGRAELGFEALGHQRRTISRIEVAEGEVAVLEVELFPGGAVRGVAVDSAGEPVPGAQVAAIGGAGWGLARAFQRMQGHRQAGPHADTPEETVTNNFVSAATRLGFMAEGAVSTAPDGTFELEGVPPGTQTIVARHRDFALAQSAPIELGEGESRDGLRLVLTRGASVHGRVTDRWDRPLPGSIVLLISPTEFSGDDAAEAAVYQGEADAEGEYEIAHVTGGQYLVALVRADEGIDPMAVLGRLRLDLISVPPEARVRRDLVDRTAAACRVFGRVLAGGETVGVGGVLALSSARESALGVDFKVARVKLDGAYEFPGLEPGAYSFVYQSEGNELRIDADVPDLPELELDLALPFGGVAGRVVDARTGAPVEGARVVLRRAGDAAQVPALLQLLATPAGSAAKDTGPEGVFELLGYQAGDYSLCVRPPERGEHAALAPAGPIAVTIARDELLRGLEVRLEPGLSISGAVREPSGAPAHRAAVLATSRATGLPAARATTGRDGRYELPGLGPGAWDVVASTRDFPDAWREGVELVDASAADVDLVLHAGVELRVRVVDAAGAPVAGATASLRSATGVSRASTDPSGNLLGWLSGKGVSGADGIVGLGALEPGTYRVDVRAAGGAAVLDGVALAAGAGVVEVTAEVR